MRDEPDVAVPEADRVDASALFDPTFTEREAIRELTGVATRLRTSKRAAASREMAALDELLCLPLLASAQGEPVLRAVRLLLDLDPS